MDTEAIAERYKWQEATTTDNDTVCGMVGIGWTAYDKDNRILMAHTEEGWSLTDALDRLKQYRGENPL